MNPWWLGLSPAQATVECGGHAHRLRWEAGELHSADHEDPEGERALAALGGQRCTCLDMLDAWERHRDDPRVLVLASRGPADRLAAQAAGHAQPGVAQQQVVRAALARHRRRVPRTMGGPVAQGSGWSAYAPVGGVSKAAQAETELITLLRLGGALQDRLVATVAAAWAKRLVRPDTRLAQVRPQLHAALHGRVFATLQSWRAGSGLETEMIAEDAKPRLTVENHLVRAELPFGWLVDVWARGIATIWGRFCLAAAAADRQTWRLLTVGADLGPPVPIDLQLRDAASRDTP